MKRAAYLVTIDLTNAESHRAQVTIRKKNEKLPNVLQFPVWTPGSYLIREYARHITLLEPAEKIAKNKWRLKGEPNSVSYEVYCYERTVRTSFLDEFYAVLVGATLLPLLHESFEVEVITPKHWNFLSSALPFKKSGKGKWKAFVQDDDQWIDCPIVAAAPGYGAQGKFTLRGMPHQIAWVGLDCAREMKDFETAFKKIAESTVKMFGGAPFKNYWFLLHFGQKLYGGLEHRNSQLSQFDGANLRQDKDWQGFLRLIAHEYFHSWNVKSIRPRALGPFDYSNENYTQDIWFAEGLTDYFDDIIPLDCGFVNKATYWQQRLKDVNLLQDGFPGQKRRSIGESSFDAWIRYYRGDEDSMNTDVSYYSKGALIGWCWDAYLQKNTKKRWTLAKLMRSIWNEFGIDDKEPLRTAKPGFTREELVAFAEKTTRVPHKKFIENLVMGREAAPWREAAAFFKVNFNEKISDSLFHHTGMRSTWRNGAFVSHVASDSAAEKAGICVNDEILAINQIRVTDNEKLQQTLNRCMQDGSVLEITVARLDRLLTKKLKWRKHKGIGVEIVYKP